MILAQNHVIDPSIAIKWFLPEINSTQARSFFTTNHVWHIPELFYLEFTSILSKKYRKRELDEFEVRKIYHIVRKLPFKIHSDHDLLDDALKLSIMTQTPIYDCLYLALSIQLKLEFVTADKRFARQLKDFSLDKYVLTLETIEI